MSDDDDLVVFCEESDDDEPEEVLEGYWKVLLVDDVADFREVIRYELERIVHNSKGIQCFEAGSRKEALDVLKSEPDMVLVITDVIMESNDAGLQLVNSIRHTLNNRKIQIMLLSAQPGKLSRHTVTQNFEIDAYVDKLDLCEELTPKVIELLDRYADLER